MFFILQLARAIQLSPEACLGKSREQCKKILLDSVVDSMYEMYMLQKSNSVVHLPTLESIFKYPMTIPLSNGFSGSFKPKIYPEFIFPEVTKDYGSFQGFRKPSVVSEKDNDFYT